MTKESLSHLALLAAAAAAPFFLSNYWIFILTEVLIMALFASSLNILLGYTGLLSFGHGAYYAVGAYVTAIIIKNYSPSLGLSIGGGVLAALLFSIVFGFLCVRLSELYFAMLTLAFSQMIYFIVFQWRDVTGGDDGLPGILRPAIDLFGMAIALNTPRSFYYFCLVIVGLSLWLLKRLVESPLGYMFRAIRDNPRRAQFAGIPVRRFRLISFVIAGFFAGLAGSIYALLAGFVSPELAFWTKSGEPVIMTLVGGIHTFFGPTVGAAIYTVLHTFIASKTEHWLLYFGLILLIIVLALPAGVLGTVKKVWGKN
jgi:branched-chain amino acid transport system permease protein